MDLISYRIPVNDINPLLSGVENVGYAENTYIVKVPDVNQIPTTTITKYNIKVAPSYVENGIQFYIATPQAAKLYKTYSSASEPDFYGEEFDALKGIRVTRPMTEQEISDRYNTIRWLRLSQLQDYYSQQFINLSVNKTPQEQATWDAQKSEAIAFTADNTVTTPTLTALADARGTSVATLAAQVLSAVSNYNASVTALFVEQETYTKQLKDAEGDDIINVRLPFDTTVIPGDTRFAEQTFSSNSGS
jgi:hypothetical protein